MLTGPPQCLFVLGIILFHLHILHSILLRCLVFFLYRPTLFERTINSLLDKNHIIFEKLDTQVHTGCHSIGKSKRESECLKFRQIPLENSVGYCF